MGARKRPRKGAATRQGPQSEAQVPYSGALGRPETGNFKVQTSFFLSHLCYGSGTLQQITLRSGTHRLRECIVP